MRVLFADDEANLQELMRSELPRMGYAATICPDGETACAVVEREPIDCMILDINMPGRSGIEVLQFARNIRPDIDVVIYTGRPTTDTAIDAVRGGAVDYLVKPCKLHDLATLLGRIAERRTLRRQVAALERRVAQTAGEPQLIGCDPAIARLREMIARVAPSDAAVMITGETGCGKELVARGVHDASHRRGEPMVAVNCGALPETLIESELFGHRKGAFHRSRCGPYRAVRSRQRRHPVPGRNRRTAVAGAGEVVAGAGDRRHSTAGRQSERSGRREDRLRDAPGFGSNGRRRRVPRRPDVPHQHVRTHVSPLRRRIGDLPELAEHLLRRHRPEAVAGRGFTPAALEALRQHAWPATFGNSPT